MNLMRWFRKHRRYLLAGLVVFIMISWGMIPALQQLLGRGARPVGAMQGKAVTQVEMQDAAASLRVIMSLGLLQPDAIAAIQSPGTTPRAMANLLALVRDLKGFLFEKEQRVDQNSQWRFLVLLREAQAAGVEVTQDQVAELLRLSPLLADAKGFDATTYGLLLSRYELTEGQVQRALAELAQVVTLVNLRRESVRASTAELWETYADAAERLKVKYIAVKGDDFLPLVKASDEEVRAFYETHKAVIGDPAAGVVGYMAPERVRLEWAEAPMDSLKAEAKVEDGEVTTYYGEHKAEFLVKEEKPAAEQPKAAEPAKKEQATADDPPADEPRPGQAAPSEGEQGASAESGAQKEAEPKAAQPPAGYRYQTLDEVRDAIRQTLISAKARQKATELLQKVLSDLDAVGERYVNEALPLGQMARRYGLTWRMAQGANGRDLVSREELELVVPDGDQVAKFAFDVAGSQFLPRVFTTGSVPLICQVLERRAAETEPFETVADQVRRDCLRQMALDRASAFAQNLKESVAEVGLEQAAETMGARLANLLGGAQSAKEAPAALKVQEAGPFSRGASQVAGMEGGHPVLVEKAFQLTGKDVGVAVEGSPVYQCEVLLVSEREPASREQFAEIGTMFRDRYHLRYKQDQVVQDWLQGLLKAAGSPGRQAAG